MSFFQKSIFLALVAIIFAIPQTADAQKLTKEPISFRGIPIDGSNVKNQVIKLCEDFNSRSELSYLKTDCRPNGERNMRFWAEFGNLKVRRIDVGFTENWAIDNIRIGVGSLENKTSMIMIELADILAGKYGKPARENNAMQNNSGAKFNQIIYSWNDARGNTMTVYSILDQVDEGALFIRSAEGEAASEKDWEMEKQRAKSKL